MTAIHCNIDDAPHSQGIRLSISARFDIADQLRKANTGVLDGLGPTLVEGEPPSPVVVSGLVPCRVVLLWDDDTP